MRRMLGDVRGQGLVEYALILVLVAIVVIASLLLLGPSVGNVFSGLVDQLESLSGTGSIASIGTSVSSGVVVVTVTVSPSPSSVTLSLQAGSGTIQGLNPKNCTGTCNFTISGQSAHGTVRATGGGGFRNATW
jgi:pilus assembly protein Flp/PilA